jgi:hypothetical protein
MDAKENCPKCGRNVGRFDGWGQTTSHSPDDIVCMFNQLADQRDLLKKDQEDWRKGVELISSSLGEREPMNLCCVRLAELALTIRSESETKSAQLTAANAENARLKSLLSAHDQEQEHGSD